MIADSAQARNLHLPSNLSGIVAAVVMGLIIAIQPLENSLFVAIAIALIGLAFVTPLAALVSLLVLSPMRTLIATESGFAFPLDIGQILFLAFIAFWITRSIADKRRLLHVVWSDLYVVLGVFVIASGATVFSAFSISAWLTEWLKWVLMLVVVLIVLNLRAAQAWEWLAFALVLSGIANALVGIYIFFGGSGALHLLIGGRFFRAFGTFGQPNPFGGFMGLLIPIAIMMSYGFIMQLWSRWRATRLINPLYLVGFMYYLSGAALMTAALFMSWSRGAWLAFGVSTLVVLVALPKRWWQGLAILIVVGLSLMALWFSGRVPATIADRIESATEELFVLSDVRAIDITTENYAIVERLAHWQAAINMAQENYWFGVGMGNYEVAYAQYNLINWDEPLGHAHNYYLNVLGEAGIIGTLCYIAMLIGIVYLTWDSRRHPDILSRSMVVGLLGTWTYLITHSLTDNLYVNNVFLHFGVMQGILAILRREIHQHLRVPVK